MPNTRGALKVADTPVGNVGALKNTSIAPVPVLVTVTRYVIEVVAVPAIGVLDCDPSVTPVNVEADAELGSADNMTRADKTNTIFLNIFCNF